jgi:hypothetical protein
MTKRTSNVTKPRTRAKKKSPVTSARKPDAVTRPGGKLGLILDRLEVQTGATVDELVDTTDWQKHSVHGALSRLRTRGFAIRLEATEGRNAYRLEPVEA